MANKTLFLKGNIMKDKKLFIITAAILLTALLSVALTPIFAKPDTSKLAVLWTSGDPDVAHKVCFMYTNAAKKQKWFNKVNLIVWGPSSRLLATDKTIQEAIKKMQSNGVIVEACQACADSYGISDKIRALGVDVKYMGSPLTNMLKSDYKVLTF